ncbi:S8 family peptidase [Actinokineospora sp. UTMC 2448]|uniref:S8 family peptidase n=1 Tax=Actinokineospora sp. UTMC 2448 TaxID=2268449 RepID=UPI002164B759|nr:S8 family peptidase [Actinokineospora sp. UTMC 2448]
MGTAGVLTTQSPVAAGLDRLDQTVFPLSNSYSYTSTGTGVNVYVIDSGLRTTHQEFSGRAFNGWDCVDNDPIAQDPYGLGTHMAAIVAGTTHGVAKNATVWGLRFSGAATPLPCLSWVQANAVAPAVVLYPRAGYADTTIDAAVDQLIAAGITVVVGAGNSNADAAAYSPARVPGAITVGALTATADTRAPFSNHGASVDVYAAGMGVLSAFTSSDASAATLNGTGQASAYAAGAAARYLQQFPTATPAQVHAAIVGMATPTDWGGRVLHLPPWL